MREPFSDTPILAASYIQGGRFYKNCFQNLQRIGGRCGLSNVPRKNKKERVTSLPHVADSKETRSCSAAEEPAGGCKSRLSIDGASCALETGPKCAANETSNSLTAPETAHTQAGFVEIRSTSSTELPKPAAVNMVDLADSFFPRTSTSGQEAFIDIEFMEYEQHVQARAQALAGKDNFGAPGGRHAWKTLIFWKRRRTMAPTSGRPFASAASTPLHHPTLQISGRKSYHGSRRANNPAMAPLYMSDEFSTSSVRAWWEPMVRGGKLQSMAGRRDAEFCNMSPYVPVGGRQQRLPAAPLYLV